MARATKPPVRDAWGSSASGSPDIVEAPYVGTGWPASSMDPVKPPRGYFNFEQNRLDNGLIYVLQHGIPDWDLNEDSYDVGDFLRSTDNRFYQLVGTATPGQAPHTDPTNWHLCLRLPRPMTGETAADATAAWRNAWGFRVTGKDHYGFDAGQLLDFRETWMGGGSVVQQTATGTGLLLGDWNYRINNGGGTVGGIFGNGPWGTDLTTHPWGPILGVNAFGQSTDAISVVETAKPIIKVSQASLVFEVNFSINGASGPQSNTGLAVGLGDGTLVTNGTTGPTLPTAHGAWIERAPGNANWLAVSKPNGGAAVGSNSGVAVARDAPHRYRCYVIGTSDSADSNARVIHMIDGVVVANDLVSLSNQTLSPFVRAAANQGEVCLINVGPMRVQARLAAFDTLL